MDAPKRWGRQPHVELLLEAIGKLTRLRRLDTVGMCFSHLETLCGDATTALTLLTASNHLTHLSIAEGTYSQSLDSPLPPTGVCCMLPAGRQLPRLGTLKLANKAYEENSDDPRTCVDASDIHSMAACLPALHSLCLVEVVKSSTAVPSLTSLQGLTHLVAGGKAFGDRGVQHLAKVTSLRALTLRPTTITVTGLEALTALTGLTLLEVQGCPNLPSDVRRRACWCCWRQEAAPAEFV